LTIKGRELADCLKIKITEDYKGLKKPEYGYVWLHKNYGIVKWIRVTNRVEIRNLNLAK